MFLAHEGRLYAILEAGEISLGSRGADGPERFMRVAEAQLGMTHTFSWKHGSS
jgi:hypothetical protein